VAKPGSDLRDVSTHFRFGENWASFAREIDDVRLAAAREDLARLVPDLAGKTFLDIGSGSGLHSLSALDLGVSRLLAVDLDPASVATTQSVLTSRSKGGTWECERRSVFELHPETQGTFDVVYSWGVLHHTGAMHEAIERAAAMVKPGGLLAIALYRKTPFCSLWKIEKRLYSRSPAAIQRGSRRLYIAAMRLAHVLLRRDFRAMVESYRIRRGMDFEHDVHDWLGGFPYESIAPQEIETFLAKRGFALERSFVRKNLGFGLFGSGNDEFVFRRSPQTS
jgi:2-polyprenyl-3-methyl-5-hydroxy-6-metoxy-1,4-benzoquinol methylase